MKLLINSNSKSDQENILKAIAILVYIINIPMSLNFFIVNDNFFDVPKLHKIILAKCLLYKKI